MRKLIAFFLFFCCLIVSTNLTAQFRKIPAEVTEALRVKYPMATNIEWRDNISGFTVTFELKEDKHLARFTNEGIWESTETEMAEIGLPAKVKESVEKGKYADWELGLIHKIELPENKIQYRVEVVKNELRKKKLYFTPEGKLVRDKMTL